MNPFFCGRRAAPAPARRNARGGELRGLVLGARDAHSRGAALLRFVELDVLGVEDLARAEQSLRVCGVGRLLLLPLGLELLVERLAAAAAGRSRRADLVGLEDLGLAVRRRRCSGSRWRRSGRPWVV